MSRLTKLDNDITKAKGTYMPYNERPIITLSNATYVQCLLNKLGKLEDLEEELGCPLEVRCKITTDTTIYDSEGNSFEVEYIHDNNFTTIMNRGFGSMYEFDFTYNDYKKTWWLKEDKSE